MSHLKLAFGDEETFCPLCIEEFDIQDRNFKPCLCGYQICQFCFNNIRNLNGLCPACRTPYDDKTIQYIPISAEEIRAEQNKKSRKEANRRKHEAQRREIEALNLKYLVEVKVVQKNLVYVTGLSPMLMADEDYIQTLCGKDYFGQYGEITKLLVNTRVAVLYGGAQDGSKIDKIGPAGLGVFVTFAKKEDAVKCITAIDGVVNSGRVLRATYGISRYCSTYLRNETCHNKNCTYLHEPGEDAESFCLSDVPIAESLQPKPQGSTAPPPPPVMEQPLNAQKKGERSFLIDSGQGGSIATDNDEEFPDLPPVTKWANNPLVPAKKPAISAIMKKARVKPPATTTRPKIPIDWQQPQVQSPSPAAIPATQQKVRVKPQASSARPAIPVNWKQPTVEPEVPALEPAIFTQQKQAQAQEPAGQTESPSASASATVRGSPAPPQPELNQPPAGTCPRLMDHIYLFYRIPEAISNPGFRFVFSPRGLSPEQYRDLLNTPPLFELNPTRQRIAGRNYRRFLGGVGL
ncbi:transcriptional repressor general negative regulator of transcription subunit 4 [Rhizina undulata]